MKHFLGPPAQLTPEIAKGSILEIGVDSFAAFLPDTMDQALVPAAQRMVDLLAEVETAYRVGLDAFGIGEHHRAEFLDSAPAVILAAAAARTWNIRLNSAVTVLSAADPVRVFQDFATIDLISNAQGINVRISKSLFTPWACWRNQ